MNEGSCNDFILKAQNVFYNCYYNIISYEYKKKPFKFGTAKKHSVIFILITI